MRTRVTASVALAAQAIRDGEVVAFPTETVYGLGADAWNDAAVKKIFSAKNRPADNPLIVHLYSTEQVSRFARTPSPNARKLMKAFFPGPLSLVLKKRPGLPRSVTAGLDTVCVRVPKGALARQLLRVSGVPIAAPSANLSGKPSPTSWQHVYTDLRGKIPLILKGPSTRHGTESTVVDCTVNPPRLLRPGAVSVERIEKVIGKIQIGGTKKASSPGMRHRHYAPDGKVFLISNTGQLPKKSGNWAFLGYLPSTGASYSVRIKTSEQYAKALYGFLRSCDKRGIRQIYLQVPTNSGLGRTIMDRIVRAAAK